MATPTLPTRRRHGRLAPGVAMVVVSVVGLTGCFTGQRPSFDERDPSREMTGDPAVDAVLERLDATSARTFTATYDTTTKLGALSATGQVVQDGSSRRSVTLNDVRFLIEGEQLATCNLATGECEARLNDARTSDLMLTHEFYADAFARRLRVDAARRVADPTGYEITQAGRPALCTDVAVTGGTKTFCAFDNGPLARYDGNDVLIEATSLTDTVDETAFASIRES